jgi:lactoylglutathione lyase
LAASARAIGVENRNGVIVFVLKFRQCVRFYRDKIGLMVLMEKPGLTRLQFGSMYLQIEDAVKFALSPTENIILRENVPSISLKQRELSEKGIELEIHDLEWGKIGFAFDPHGNKLEYFREK